MASLLSDAKPSSPIHAVPVCTPTLDSSPPLSPVIPVIGLKNEPILISSSPVKEDSSERWLPSLKLSARDKAILESEEWLNDAIIHAAQCLLKEHTSGKISGWQSPQYATREKGFCQIPLRILFIQLLHVNNNHWVVISNIDLRNPEYGHCHSVQCYDSGLALRVGSQTKRSICSLLKCPAKEITIELMNVEGQVNLFDCGVYALACATELAFEGDPVQCSWVTSSRAMRDHLISCFEQGSIIQFPKKNRRVGLGRHVRKFVREPLFCDCRMPWDRQSKQSPMIQCGTCKKWFHFLCMGLDGDTDYSELKWLCKLCDNIEQQKSAELLIA